MTVPPDTTSAGSKTGAPSSATQYLRGVMIALALLLPMFSLVVLGTLWLWQNNLLLVWSIAASVLAMIIYGAEVWLVRRREQEVRAATGTTATEADTSADGMRTPREQAAWAAVEQLAGEIDPDTLNNRDAVLALATHTVETVARHMHPGERDPLWKFTVPEALALLERVSRQLNNVIIESVPLGDRLTIGQVLTVYRWRSLTKVAEKAYDLWRVLRFINPASAIAGELREKVSGRLVEGMRTEFTRRLARAYVREIGSAAIDLYSGRLRPDLVNASEPAPEVAAVAPLDILVVGAQGVGKSSLINALSDEVQAAVDVLPTSSAFTTHVLSRDDAPLTNLTESPGLDVDEKRVKALIERAENADAVIWAVSTTRPDRAADAIVLTRLRESFEERADRRAPPVLFVLTHMDRVRPFNEWQPPYDLSDEERTKSRSIREAMVAVADDFEIGVDEIIPIAMPERQSAYNVDLVWARLLDTFDEARNVQLLRRLSNGMQTPITTSLWRQAVGAGRVLRNTIFD